MATTTFPHIVKQRDAVLYPHAHWYFLLAIATTWLGFAQSYFVVIRTQPLLHHIHGALMGGWIALLIVQPILYQRGKMRLHRTLGRWGAFALVPAIMVVGFLMMRSALIATAIPPFLIDHLLFLDFTALLLLPTYVGLAIYYGRNIDLHARYIVSTVLLLLPPAIVRAMPILPIFRKSFHADINMGVGLMSLILVVLLIDDARRGKVRAPYMVALVANTAVGVAANYAKDWAWWHALTAWMVRL
ncbi:hypothetical protein [Terriglobus roseus]|uniref:Uncharacterized protein n=1 Tax=Terriglobus roseus TaxID=392734 RepID=A0A1H4PQA6_9BACT|nr:hypothetical protein [Terriglobus roseus]SEC09408.1 hypothetical protein SAMN05443244_2634 [Terriglobus roseus]